MITPLSVADLELHPCAVPEDPLPPSLKQHFTGSLGAPRGGGDVESLFFCQQKCSSGSDTEPLLQSQFSKSPGKVSYNMLKEDSSGVLSMEKPGWRRQMKGLSIICPVFNSQKAEMIGQK